MSKKYDVIVIGAGMGGLTAAAILARKGKKVLVLEKASMVGGYVVDFRRGDFKFDVSLHLIDGFSAGGYINEVVKECGILDRVKLLRPKYLYRSIYPDFDINVPQANIEEYVEILISLFPDEAMNISQLFKEMIAVFKEARRFLYDSFPFGFEVAIAPLKYRSVVKYFTKTYQQMLDRYLKDYKLKAIISQLWSYFGLPPKQLSSFYYAFPFCDYLCGGGYYPQGGASALTSSLQNVIAEHGGEVCLKTAAKKIIIKNRVAKGVMTEKDEFIESDFIVSNIDARKTFLDLIGTEFLTKRYVNKIKQLQPSISAFQVYLGLNCDLKKMGYSDYEVFYNPNYDIDRQFFKGAIGGNMNESLYTLTISSNLDCSVSVPGKSVLEIAVVSGYDFWAKFSQEEYKKQKQKLAYELINRVEKLIPKVSSYIEKIEISTPLTLEKYTSNYKGAIYGASQVVFQSGIKRLRNTTPIANLYLAGAWTRMGGGVSMVMAAGSIAAKRILSKG